MAVRYVVEFKGASAILGAASPEEAGKTRHKAKRRAGKWTAAYLKNRIQKKGKGAGGSDLKGYSTRPVRVSRGLLKKRVPPGGFPKYYKGGYAAYREDVGLQIDHFAFTNTGTSFNRFGSEVADQAPNTPIVVGFASEKSHLAAMVAVEKGRSDMFDLSDRELDRVMGIYLDSVVASAWKGIFEGAEATEPATQTVEE